MNPFWSPGELLNIVTAGETPTAFRQGQGEHRVLGISAHWRVHTLWWSEDEVWRDYWEVTTDTGRLCVLYHDLIGDAWYLERIYE
jgi:hypothetical protein